VAPGCPVCRSSGPIEQYTLREMLFGTRERFEYLRCGACGVLWLDGPPQDLSPYYPPTYHTAKDGGGIGAAEPMAARWLREQLVSRRLFGGHRIGAALARRFGIQVSPDVGAVRPMVRGARLRSFDDPIVDVGCGPVPERLWQLSRAGFRSLLGIDPMIEGDVDDGIPVRRITIHELKGSFALLTFHHSFEHVRDPRETLVAARRLLRPGGAIVIRTPVMGTWFWDTYGKDWWELDPPRHLFVHTQRSLELLAADAGLTLERVDFESTYLEILASDQIARDIPWRDPASCLIDLTTPELQPAIAAAKATAQRLNAERRGGRASFLFRASGAEPAGER
jgi:SAM-dependent methyltransferase